MHKKVEAEKRLQQLQFVFTHRERNIGKYRDLLDERVLNANFNLKFKLISKQTVQLKPFSGNGNSTLFPSREVQL